MSILERIAITATPEHRQRNLARHWSRGVRARFQRIQKARRPDGQETRR
jgi:hypothetical protein